ncbi:MAG: hypothetical protein KKF89_05415 [Nanoarchaeota archaeon]|nr:hypothetical protein [Nanoarchaeota archaeon]MBU1855134.1 hypothetical protein [Nanoarchaeota archaeon]
MKQFKTWLLLLILVVLLVVKFFPHDDSARIVDEPKQEVVHDIVSVDLSNKVHNTFFLDKTVSGVYNISLLYIVLYDSTSKGIISSLEDGFMNRLSLFDNFIYQESLGKMTSSSNLLFLDVKEFGSKELSYDKQATDWIKLLYSKFESDSYNTFVFVPIYSMDWCGDGLSQGFNYNGRIFFCMEAFFNPNNPVENTGAIGLMTHKFLHGVGFNHQDQMFMQYQFLDWQMGLPETNILLHGNFRDFNHLFFNEYVLKILGVVNRTSFEDSCLDSEEFVCESSNTFFCKDSWGSFCQDVDNDGVVDSEDDYVFSSPVNGSDSDGDGVVDSLDLCDWNKISVSGNNIIANPLEIKATGSPVKIVFSGKEFVVHKIVATPFEMIGGFIKFNDKKSFEIKSSELILSVSDSIFWRIQAFYKYNNTEYYRPYYLIFPSFNADFFFEKEWYYFSRFGCDIPSSVNFADTKSYDSNLDGLPDLNLFYWPEDINQYYDWDDDNYSDLIDTLPTVKGFCANEYVRGVKDSDNDNFCDPGEFDFSSNKNVENYELSMTVKYNKFTDLCPYISGSNKGCP